LSIPDPKTATKEKGEKKFVVLPFFVAANIIKIENYFIFELMKKKIRANLQRIIELFTQKFVISFQNYTYVWIPGSEIRDPEKSYSGSWIRGQKGTGSRIRIGNTA
jgi:hypothetical protein